MQQLDLVQLERRRFLSLMALGTAGTMVPSAAWAKTAAPELYPNVRKGIDALVGSGNLPGLLGTVGRGAEPPVTIAAGTISQMDDIKVNVDTLWRVYSMTKPLTGITAMMLIEEGKLKLDQPIADILPEFANMRVLTDPDKSMDSVPAKTQITIRHLLTHTAGLGYTIITKGPLLQAYLDNGLNPAIASRKALPNAPAVAPTPDIDTFSKRLATLPLVAEPGTRWSYSVSLDLLGHIIGKVSGVEFGEFMKQRLFDPLKMTSSYFQVPKDQAKRLVTNYAPFQGILFPIDTGPNSIYLDKPAFSFGGSGLVCSARDYDRFLAMLLNKGTLDGATILKPETVELATSNLMPDGVVTAGTFAAGAGFGAGGRVGLGDQAGSFGWGGAAGTIAFIQKKLNVRGTGMAQYMPSNAFPFPDDFTKWVLADTVGKAQG